MSDTTYTIEQLIGICKELIGTVERKTKPTEELMRRYAIAFDPVVVLSLLDVAKKAGLAQITLTQTYLPNAVNYPLNPTKYDA